MGNNVYINLHGQQGDIMTAMSVLKYKNELWGNDCHIIWYADKNNFDLFAHQDIEVREFPRGFGYPEMVEEENNKLIAEGKEPAWADWQHLMDENNHLDLELAKDNQYFTDAKAGFFPAPHQMSVRQRHLLTYPTCSKKVFGVPMDWEWHPVLMFSDEERELVNGFIKYVKARSDSKYVIAVESFAGSGQSLIEDWEVRKIMEICNEVLGNCSFIFMSHKYLRTQEEFSLDILAMPNVFSAKNFTVRQCALIVEQSNLLVSVSSGISVASVAWGLNTPPIIQLCGSEICSTRELSQGKRFELITHDDKVLDDAYNEMNSKLYSLLEEIK